MRIPEHKFHTIRTLYELGNSVHMIAIVVGIPKSTLYDNISEIVDGYNPKGVKRLKVSEYVNASLIALSIETDTDKSKISALNGVKDLDGDTDVDVAVDITEDVKSQILEELK